MRPDEAVLTTLCRSGGSMRTRSGWYLLTDSHRSIHLVIGLNRGTFEVDSKRYRRPPALLGRAAVAWPPAPWTAAWTRCGGRPSRSRDPRLRPRPADLPVLCVHVARLPWQRELLVDGIPSLPPAPFAQPYRRLGRYSHLSKSNSHRTGPRRIPLRSSDLT